MNIHSIQQNIKDFLDSPDASETYAVAVLL